VLRDIRAGEQRQTPVQGAGGEVLGQFEPRGGVGDDAGGGDQLLGLAADVGCVPRGASSGQPGQHPCRDRVAVQRAHRSGRESHRLVGVPIAQSEQLAPPPFVQVHPGRSDHLVGTTLGPRAGIPGPTQPRPRPFTSMCPRPFPFIATPVAPDLRRPSAERPQKAGQLPNFAITFQ
jgi:hypothetical protein